MSLLKRLSISGNFWFPVAFLVAYLAWIATNNEFITGVVFVLLALTGLLLRIRAAKKDPTLYMNDKRDV